MTLQILFGLMSVTLWLYNCWYFIQVFQKHKFMKNKIIISIMIEGFILSIPLIFVMGIIGVIIQFFLMTMIGNKKETNEN